MDRAGNCKQPIHAHDPGSQTTGNQSKLKSNTSRSFPETMPNPMASFVFWHHSLVAMGFKMFIEVEGRYVESELYPRQQADGQSMLIYTTLHRLKSTFLLLTGFSSF